MNGGPRCRRHPEAAAGWRCDGCFAPLCPDCVEVKRFGSATAEACLLCGSHARAIRVHRATVPYAVRLVNAWRYPLTQSGLMAMAAAGLVFHLLSAAWLLGELVARALELGYLFSLIRATAAGSDEIGPPEFRHLLDDVIVPALQGFVATAFIWLPAVLYVYYAHEGPGTVSEALADPVVWLFVAAGIAYVPIAILIAAGGGGFLQMLNPVAVVGYVLRIPGDYAVAVAVTVLLGFLAGFVGIVTGAIARTNVLLLSGWLAWTLSLFVPFVWARVLGLLLHVRGDQLGHGRPDDYLVPVLGDARPRRGEVDIGPQAAEAAMVEAQLLAPDPPPSAVIAGAAAEEAPPDPAAWAAAIEHALQRADMPAAVQAYRTMPEGLDAAIPPADLLEIGRAAATMGDYPLAARALRAAGEQAPRDPVAPRALVVLGRVYAERLGDAAAAAEVYRRVVERYPGTEAARFAQERLDAAPAAPKA